MDRGDGLVGIRPGERYAESSAGCIRGNSEVEGWETGEKVESGTGVEGNQEVQSQARGTGRPENQGSSEPGQRGTRQLENQEVWIGAGKSGKARRTWRIGKKKAGARASVLTI